MRCSSKSEKAKSFLAAELAQGMANVPKRGLALLCFLLLTAAGSAQPTIGGLSISDPLSKVRFLSEGKPTHESRRRDGVEVIHFLQAKNGSAELSVWLSSAEVVQLEGQILATSQTSLAKGDSEQRCRMVLGEPDSTSVHPSISCYPAAKWLTYKLPGIDLSIGCEKSGGRWVVELFTLRKQI